MEGDPDQGVTYLLDALRNGDSGALARLVPLVYDELHALGHRHRIRWNGNYTLNTTGLVHEAYLKLVDQKRASWENRAHFIAAAAQAMRHILINYARDRRAAKRGGARPNLSIETEGLPSENELPLTDEQSDFLIALDEALRHLELVNERQSRIVECRFFGGMSIEETASVLGISTASVSRGWVTAKTRLYRDIKPATAS